MLEQADVAGHKRRREEPEDLPEGEVPRHNGQNNAERIPTYKCLVSADVDGFRNKDPLGLIGIVTASGCAFENLRAGGGDWFAHFRRKQRGQVSYFSFEQMRELPHAELAMAEGRLRVLGERLVRQRNLLLNGRIGEWREAARKLACCRIDRLSGHGTTPPVRRCRAKLQKHASRKRYLRAQRTRPAGD